ncbi:MAG: relaxase, partial [Pseudomonadota bacterium]
MAVTFEGEVISIARATGIKAKDLKSRIGEPDVLRSVEDTRKRIGEDILPRIKSHLDEARSAADAEKEQLEERREDMAYAHALERTRLDLGQRARAEQEARNRAERFRKGMAGLWDRLTGQHSKLAKQNEMEALWALRRDQEQRQGVIEAQLEERQALQLEIRAMRERHAEALRELHFDATNYRLMKRGQEPKTKPSFEQARPLIPMPQTKPEPQPQPKA